MLSPSGAGVLKSICFPSKSGCSACLNGFDGDVAPIVYVNLSGWPDLPNSPDVGLTAPRSTGRYADEMRVSFTTALCTSFGEPAASTIRSTFTGIAPPAATPSTLSPSFL